MCAITFYIGKDDLLGTADVGMTQAVVMRLVDPIKGRGNHIYTDNYYTSPQLFSDLSDSGFGACGTVQVNRHGLPAAMKERVRQRLSSWITECLPSSGCSSYHAEHPDCPLVSASIATVVCHSNASLAKRRHAWPGVHSVEHHFFWSARHMALERNVKMVYSHLLVSTCAL